MRKDIVRTFVVYVEDKPGVLTRAASLFRRRAFNIESLNVGQTHRAGISRMTVVIEADEDTARRIERELALVKVRAAPEMRSEILQAVEVFGARVVDMAPTTMVVEISGSPDRIAGLKALLEPYGIEEMVQTGSVAMTRGHSPNACY
jgi:acetolactate synthase-1/3 small subunit